MIEISNIYNTFAEKESLSEEENVQLTQLLALENDFSDYVSLYLRFGVLDTIASELLLKRANEEQVMFILERKIPLMPSYIPIYLFLIIKNYKKMYKEIYSFLMMSDDTEKRAIVKHILFTGEYLTILSKFVKNSEGFIACMIASRKVSSSNYLIFAESNEPEVLFRLSNLAEVKSNIPLVKLILTNPYTPDESVIYLKQILVDYSISTAEKNVEEEKADDKISDDKENVSIDTLYSSSCEDNITKEEESLYSRIGKMSTPEKIKLALKGNKSARGMLIKDPNKQISTSVLKNPKITEEEVEFISKSKASPEHIVREITRNGTWMKNSAIARGLAFNPKTPFDISITLLSRMPVSDLEKISKSKDVPTGVKNQAIRIFEAKTKGKK